MNTETEYRITDLIIGERTKPNGFWPVRAEVNGKTIRISFDRQWDLNHIEWSLIQAYKRDYELGPIER